MLSFLSFMQNAFTYLFLHLFIVFTVSTMNLPYIQHKSYFTVVTGQVKININIGPLAIFPVLLLLVRSTPSVLMTISSYLFSN